MPSPDEILRALPDATTDAIPASSPETSSQTTIETPSANISTNPPANLPANKSPNASGNISGNVSGITSTNAAIEQQHEPQSMPARDIETQSSPDNSDTADAPQLNSLADIASLAEEKGEMLLAALIRNHVRLVALQPGLLEIALTGKPPEKFLGDLAQHLRHWTGARWLVSLSDEPAGKTLAETKAVAAAERRDTIARTPLVTKIAAIFPGATIEEISAIDAPVNELDKDTESDDEEDTD